MSFDTRECTGATWPRISSGAGSASSWSGEPSSPSMATAPIARWTSFVSDGLTSSEIRPALSELGFEHRGRQFEHPDCPHLFA
jgi:hypothetical protein